MSVNNKSATVDSNFASSAAIWRNQRNMHFVFDSGPLAPFCENMTLSVKPEMHMVLNCRRMMTKQRPLMCSENL